MAAGDTLPRLSRKVLTNIPPTDEIRAALGEALNEVSALRRMLKMARDRDMADARAADRGMASQEPRQ